MVDATTRVQVEKAPIHSHNVSEGCAGARERDEGRVCGGEISTLDAEVKIYNSLRQIIRVQGWLAWYDIVPSLVIYEIFVGIHDSPCQMRLHSYSIQAEFISLQIPQQLLESVSKVNHAKVSPYGLRKRRDNIAVLYRYAMCDSAWLCQMSFDNMEKSRQLSLLVMGP